MPLAGCLLAVCLLLAAGPQPAPDLGALAARATEAMAKERYQEAAGLYEQLLRARPADAGLLMNLGMARVLAGRPAEAVDPLTRATRLDDSLTAAWLFIGRAYAALGQADKAVAPLERAVAADSDDLAARRLLAESRYSTGQYAEAAADYRVLTARLPSSARAWYGLASSYAALTAQAAEQIRKEDAGSPYVRLLEAELAMAAGEYQKAASLVTEALKELPDVPGPRLVLADAYEQIGQGAEATAAREQDAAAAAKCSTPTPACALAKGEPLEAAKLAGGAGDAASAYWRMQAYNALAADAWSTLENLPPSAEWHYVRSLVAEEQGDQQQALEELRRAHALEPANQEIVRRLGVRLLRTRQVDEAITLLEKATAGEADPELLYLLGEAFLLNQRPDAAVAPLEKAVKVMPQLTPARGALGRAYLQTGRAAEAIPHLEAGLSQDRDGSLYYQLAQAYQRAGRTEEAKKALAEYQKRRKN